MAVPPIDIKIKMSGAQEAKGDVEKLSGAFEAVAKRANGATASLKATGKATGDLSAASGGLELFARRANGAALSVKTTAQNTDTASKSTRGFTLAVDANGATVGTGTRRIAAMAQESKRAGDEFKNAEKSTRSFAQQVKDGANALKEMGRNAVETGKAAAKVWDIYRAVKNGGPASLFSAAIPDQAIKKASFGMIASGVAGGAALGTTVEPAMTKQLRMRAIEGIMGSEGAAKGVYNAADKQSTSSVFGLGELTVAAKTLAKDRQFTERLLRAADDLAAANKDEGASPQDVARMLGRLRAGDSGEALERARDFGIGRPDLEAKGLKFDNQGALEDKSVAGIDKAIEAITKIIEERFGGLSQKLATTTLEGSLSNLGDAFNRARTVIGEEFIPVLNFGAQTLTMLTTWFANLPDPIIKVIAWGTALVSGLSILGGVLMIGTLLWGKARLALMAVHYGIIGINFVLGLFGTSLSALTMSMLVSLLPTIAIIGAALSTLLIVALSVQFGIEAAAAASSQSAAELRNHWSGLGNFWVEAGALLERIWNHPLLAWLHGGNKQKGDADEAESLRLTNESRKRRGLAPLASQSGRENDGDNETESVETSRARQRERARSGAIAESQGKVADGTPEQELKKWQEKTRAMFMNMGAKDASASTPTGISISGLGASAVPGATPEIDALQSQLDAAYLSKDKDGTRAVRLELRNRKAAERARLRAERDEERGLKKAERDALRAQRKSEREQAKKDKRADKLEDFQAEIELAKIDEEFATRIAQLESQKGKGDNSGIDAQIDQIKAAKEIKEADIRARTVGDDDPQKANSIRQIAALRARGIQSRIGLGRQKNGKLSLEQTLAMFRGGASPEMLEKSGASVSSTQDGGFGGSGSRAFTPEVQSMGRNPVGQIIIQFKPLVIDDAFKRAVRGVR